MARSRGLSVLAVVVVALIFGLVGGGIGAYVPSHNLSR